ncbi:MAG: ABC-three component system protein [Pseudomonadota bacterium]
MDDFTEIDAPPATASLSSPAQLQAGPPIEPYKRLFLYSADDWEEFIDEWVSAVLKPDYAKVMRFSGANDRGIDIAAFTDESMLAGAWDNYQCKHYAAPLTPGTAWPEIGKILWHSFQGHYVPPRAYYFVAPKGVGTTLAQLLANTANLKTQLLEVWDKNVADKITSKQTIALTGEFAEYVETFDFSIFKSITPRELIEGHRQTPYFIPRFGGALPARPVPTAPPTAIKAHESKYVGHLLAAYADHTKKECADVAALNQWKPLKEHFKRQRESFYHAESLRIFVRDKVEPGTYEGLQQEVYDGIVDTVDADHPDGLARVKSATMTAQSISLDAHPLGQSALVKDRHGICHQLANEDRLKWTK